MGEPLYITHELAQRLEGAEAADAADCAEAYCRLNPDSASVKAVAGGVLAFTGSGSPFTHALSLGMCGPVTESDMDEIEEFFQSRGSSPVIDVCPHADFSLVELLSARRYQIVEFANVLVRSLGPGEAPPDCAGDALIRRAEPSEADLYSTVTMKGFLSRDFVNDDEYDIARVLFGMDSSTAYLAFIEGEPVGGGGLSVRNGVACCFGDATLSHARGKKVQTALIGARLQAAIDRGCDVITATTQPGSVSQRNYERLGFRVAYTKATMMKA